MSWSSSSSTGALALVQWLPLRLRHLRQMPQEQRRVRRPLLMVLDPHRLWLMCLWVSLHKGVCTQQWHRRHHQLLLMPLPLHPCSQCGQQKAGLTAAPMRPALQVLGPLVLP